MSPRASKPSRKACRKTTQPRLTRPRSSPPRLNRSRRWIISPPIHHPPPPRLGRKPHESGGAEAELAGPHCLTERPTLATRSFRRQGRPTAAAAFGVESQCSTLDGESLSLSPW